ncbi:hypothetical protein C2S52_011407 [Perilla frutescens var. hirtella]|nr:hypothetical protein C2S52_011407 [Perilla frutescens var. hirtella]
MFMRVQDSISRMKYCISALEEEDTAGGIQKFKVLERRILNDYFRKEYTYMVEYRRNGDYISCNCRNFEFKRILCCHIFEVLRNLNVETVNDRYILRRWRKDVQRRCSSIFFAGGYPHMTPEYKKFQEVEKFFQDNADLAFGNVEKMDFIKRKCMEIKNRLENWNSTTATNVSDSRMSGRSNVVGTPILNPQVIRTKGRPTEKRFKSCLEKGGRGRGRTTRARGGNSGNGNRRASSSQELKDVFYSFENFKKLPGSNYDEENNVVTAADAYFSGFNDFNKESPVHQEFRVNGMDEFRAIREIVVIGGVIKLDFEALSSRVDC